MGKQKPVKDAMWICLCLAGKKISPKVKNSIMLDKNSINEFFSFMKEKEAFLDTGLVAFTTDNHGN